MIDVIVINYNYADYVISLLNSLNDCQRTSSIFQKIICVDNNSTDNSKQYLKSWFENRPFGYTCCFLEKNSGYSFAVNQGARLGDSQYIMILNADMLVLDNFWKEKFLKVFNLNLGVGVVGCKLVDQYGKVVGAGTVGTFHKREFRAYGVNDSDNPNDIFNQQAECINVCGACYMVKRKVFEKLGGFDEDFFMYHEEEYFSFKVQKILDMKVIYTPSVKFLHYSGVHKATNESRYIKRAGQMFVKKCKQELGLEVLP